MNCRRCPVVRRHHHRTGLWRYFDWIARWHWYDYLFAAGVAAFYTASAVYAAVHGWWFAFTVTVVCSLVALKVAISTPSSPASKTPPSQSP